MVELSIENSALLKKWLLEKCKDLSEAEPDVLADYVLALLNNKVEGDELFKLLASQLEDFVSDSETFAKQIVTALESKSYSDNTVSSAPADPIKQKQEEQQKALELTQLYKPDFTTYLQPSTDKKKQKPTNTHGVPSRVATKLKQKTSKDTLLSLVSTKEEKTNKLIVANIPEDNLQETILRTYFQRFGDITNVEISYGSRTAEIEFVTTKSASNAWSSTAPIFDNRFVKVFFKAPEVPTTDEAEKIPVIEEPAFDLEAFKLRQEEEQTKWEEKQRKTLKFKEDLKKLIALKEGMLANYEKELSSLENQLRENPELEEEIKTKYEAIEKAMNSNGVTPILIAQDKARLEGRSSYSSRGAIRNRGRGRGGFGHSPYSRPTKSNTLDFRTKSVIIKNFNNPQDERLNKILGGIGVENIVPKDNDLVVSFKDRFAAEKFKNIKLQLGASTPLLETVWDESSRTDIADQDGDVGM